MVEEMVTIIIPAFILPPTQEYEFFFEMKFGKKPKLTKKTT